MSHGKMGMGVYISVGDASRADEVNFTPCISDTALSLPNSTKMDVGIGNHTGTNNFGAVLSGRTAIQDKIRGLYLRIPQDGRQVRVHNRRGGDVTLRQ